MSESAFSLDLVAFRDPRKLGPLLHIVFSVRRFRSRFFESAASNDFSMCNSARNFRPSQYERRGLEKPLSLALVTFRRFAAKLTSSARVFIKTREAAKVSGRSGKRERISEVSEETAQVGLAPTDKVCMSATRNGEATEAGRMKVTLRKIKKADSWFGDRACTVRQPATYAVVCDGTVAGIVAPDGQSTYFRSASWSIFTTEGERVGSGFGSREGAVSFVTNRVEKYGSVVLPEGEAR